MNIREHAEQFPGVTTTKRNVFLALGFLFAWALPASLYAAGPPEHAKAVFMRGEVTIIHIDEVLPEQSRFAYFLRPEHATDPEDVVEMIFEGKPPAHLVTGKKINVKGKAARGKIWVTEVAAVDGESSSSTTGGTTATVTTGDRKTITFVRQYVWGGLCCPGSFSLYANLSE